MGMQIEHAPRLIEKENIPNLHFPNSDVLISNNDRKQRFNDLCNANELGDLAQYKVKIVFEDDAGPKKVETTVWGTTQQEVVLKFGIRIPIQRISKVMFP